MSKHGKLSAVKNVAKALRMDALSRKNGELLGSEEELLARYGISRPTLRQATALLAQEQLLVIKRGVNGGYFTRLPDAKGVAHTAAIYLQSRHTSLQEIIEAVLPIKVEMASLACRNRNPASMQSLQKFRDHDATLPHGDYIAFLKSESEFGALLGDICGNNVLRLFLETLYDFCAQLGATDDIYRNKPDRVTQYWEVRDQMVDAVLRNDEELAAMFARRCALLAAKWTLDDLGSRNTARPFTTAIGHPSSADLPAAPRTPASHVGSGKLKRFTSAARVRNHKLA